MPEMFEGEVNETRLASYFADLLLVGPLEIRIKRAERAHSIQPTTSLDLETARGYFEDGTVPMLQIRYHHDGYDWWDTLIAGELTTRLIRVRHSFD